ncbi:MAG: hypothetical protein HQM14_16295 [SAR324 cluster bacterium]|nr:hypothetical protein [SAR324 cluster bacterium]
MLTMKHQTLTRRNNPCNQVMQSQYAVIGKVPVAYIAALFYGGILGQLLHMFQAEKVTWLWISTGIIIAILVSCYYAYLLFYKLRLKCMACIRLYLINAMMAICLLGYYWYG